MSRLRTAFLVWLACLLPLQATAATLQWACEVRHAVRVEAMASGGHAATLGEPCPHASAGSEDVERTSGSHAAPSHAVVAPAAIDEAPFDHAAVDTDPGADPQADACSACGWCGLTAVALPMPWRVASPPAADGPAGPRASAPPAVVPTRLERPPSPAQA